MPSIQVYEEFVVKFLNKSVHLSRCAVLLKKVCENGHILTPRRFQYENSLEWFVTICKKGPRARSNAQQGMQFPLAFQLAVLQVDAYSVYG